MTTAQIASYVAEIIKSRTGLETQVKEYNQYENAKEMYVVAMFANGYLLGEFDVVRTDDNTGFIGEMRSGAAAKVDVDELQLGLLVDELRQFEVLFKKIA